MLTSHTDVQTTLMVYCATPRQKTAVPFVMSPRVVKNVKSSLIVIHPPRPLDCGLTLKLKLKLELQMVSNIRSCRFNMRKFPLTSEISVRTRCFPTCSPSPAAQLCTR